MGKPVLLLCLSQPDFPTDAWEAIVFSSILPVHKRWPPEERLFKFPELFYFPPSHFVVPPLVFPLLQPTNEYFGFPRFLISLPLLCRHRWCPIWSALCSHPSVRPVHIGVSSIYCLISAGKWHMATSAGFCGVFLLVLLWTSENTGIAIPLKPRSCQNCAPECTTLSSTLVSIFTEANWLRTLDPSKALSTLLSILKCFCMKFINMKANLSWGPVPRCGASIPLWKRGLVTEGPVGPSHRSGPFPLKMLETILWFSLISL